MAFSSLHFISCPLSSPKIEGRAEIPWRLNISSMAQKSSEKSGRGRRIWRRRKLMKKDDKLQYKMERIPFLEEQVRKIKETGKLLSMDIERLLLSEDNRFDFVNEVAAEAKSYVENNPDEYGGKKAILHVLSNRMNDAGVHREEAYLESDPFKPGPTYLKEEL
ncbi:protein PLASTID TRANSCRIPTIONALLY ACTIVE 7 [Magnolia sinica]|uniref:protein PLASTID TRANSCRIPTIONALLY ACTIVE 7 n=1 Tax=Magnolia sinica TaxID=86752 RepID=UPI00265AD633|nr:protein PLASTID TRANSCRIPTIONALLY ACTIVE 7 [Magnolia sinica]